MGKTRFGLALSNRLPVINPKIDMKQSLLELGVNAERSGVFDSLWVGDNILTKPRADPISILSGLAALTSKVKLGVACMATLGLRNPIFLAQQWATLDRLSNGRAIMVACMGGSDGQISGSQEFKTFGHKLNERVAMMIEGIEVLRKLSSEQEVSYSGRFHVLDKVTVEPKPVQQPLPIWIAGYPQDPEIEERALRRIARLADGWLVNVISPEKLSSLWKKIQSYSTEYGRTMRDNMLFYHICIDEDQERAEKELSAYGSAYYSPAFIDKMQKNESLDLWASYGRADDCIKGIEKFVNAGANSILVRFATLEKTQRQMEIFVKDVAPSFL